MKGESQTTDQAVRFPKLASKGADSATRTTVAQCNFVLQGRNRRCSRETEPRAKWCWQHRYFVPATVARARPKRALQQTARIRPGGIAVRPIGNTAAPVRPSASVPDAVIAAGPVEHDRIAFHYVELFRQKFAFVHERIRTVQKMVFQQRGLFFTRHVYSVEELLASPEFSKIDSTARKIADDFHQWYSRGAVSDQGLLFYEMFRQQCEERFEDLQASIRDRRPTFWEAAVQSLNGFVKLVLSVLPVVERATRLLTSHSSHSSPRLLPARGFSASD